MIDAHLYVEPPHSSDVGALPILERPAIEVATALRRELASAGVRQALALGPVARTIEMANWLPSLFAVAQVDPTRTEASHLAEIESELRSGRVRGLTACLGHAPDHPGFRPYLDLAERLRVPVIFQAATKARLRNAHPLLLDDVAVDHPQVQFVLTRFGCPWFADAAAVIARNANIWADLSGLITGRPSPFGVEEQEEALRDLRKSVRRAFLAAGRPNRFLFGSGWPRVPIAAYCDFIRSIVPAACHALVFEENARALFQI